MDALQDILDRVKKLAPADRQRLVEVIERGLPEEEEKEEPETKEHRESRLAAFDRFLARAGTVHSDFTDVSSNKYKHLAEIYADDHMPADKK